MKTMPLYEAKNRFSELIAAVERGETVAITRRGRRVARLVGDAGEQTPSVQQRERTADALRALQELRRGLRLAGDPKAIAREGLD